MSADAYDSPELFDVTARKVHQTACVLLVVAGFLLGSWAGIAAVTVAGIVMLGGRFWWPLDVFRQIVWRVLEPLGLLRRRDVAEDHSTRRVARILGGIVFLLGAVALALGAQVAWIPVGAIAIMIALDATFNFCALCALTYHAGRLTARQSSGAQ